MKFIGILRSFIHDGKQGTLKEDTVSLGAVPDDRRRVLVEGGIFLPSLAASQT